MLPERGAYEFCISLANRCKMDDRLLPPAAPGLPKPDFLERAGLRDGCNRRMFIMAGSGMLVASAAPSSRSFWASLAAVDEEHLS